MMATVPKPVVTTTHTLSSPTNSIMDQFDYDVVPLSKVIVDYSYARPLTQARMRRLGKMKYDPKKAGTLYMSLRENGDYAVIDGQGRIYLAQQSSVTRVPARIYIDLTPEQEADLYLAFNRDRAATTAADDFLAEVIAGDATALAIKELVESMGLQIDRGSGLSKNTIRSVAVIEQIYKDWGSHVLREALQVTLECWGGQAGTLTGAIVGGITAFIVRYPDITSKQRSELIRRLKSTEPKRLMGRARSKQEEVHGMSVDQAVGRVILAIYNHGRPYTSNMVLGPWLDRVMTPAARAAKPESARRAAQTRRARNTEQGI